ncbi:hypothetical protein B4119_3059 [Parageobacillus caldoxylosilyticus]|uniref:Uncharacterized protein n=1 Tax=Saccharococcus caldoxylosilyticus TaxID=81408 RepID=A0A150LSH8_9BACL|nr:hypothetical protein B4119_3059 [Parageobacillus caldoxylosilyticus]
MLLHEKSSKGETKRDIDITKSAGQRPGCCTRKINGFPHSASALS